MHRKCKVCGVEISQERLTVLPDTTTCVEHFTGTRPMARPYGLSRHKGWEIEIIEGLPEEKPLVLKPKRERPDPPPMTTTGQIQDVIITRYPLVCRDNTTVSREMCFRCKRPNHNLSEYRPFPGVYCPRDLRRVKQGRFVLETMWKEANV